MTAIIVLAVLALVVIALLESSNRRNAPGLGRGPYGAWSADDRDLARTKLDLLALGGAAEPFSHKPAIVTRRDRASRATKVTRLHRTRLHGRHAA